MTLAAAAAERFVSSSRFLRVVPTIGRYGGTGESALQGPQTQEGASGRAVRLTNHREPSASRSCSKHAYPVCCQVTAPCVCCRAPIPLQ